MTFDLAGTLVLKHDSLVLLSDAFGDISGAERGLGLYLGDTRMLSAYELRVNGAGRSCCARAGPAGIEARSGWPTAAVPIRRCRRLSMGIVRERLAR